jgi:hypothetical protein
MAKCCWKVVTKERKSCSVPGGIYSLTYKQGEIINAIKESFGIFCFRTKNDAIIFRKTYNLSCMIIRVKPLCRTKTSKFRFSPVILKNEYFYFLKIKELGYMTTYKVPKGTVCYQSVEVLD